MRNTDMTTVASGTLATPFHKIPLHTAMGKMRECDVWSAEGKMWNGMCGTTVVGRDVTPRDLSYSEFDHTPCVNCVEVNCILSMWKIAFCTMHATFRCWFVDIADEC